MTRNVFLAPKHDCSAWMMLPAVRNAAAVLVSVAVAANPAVSIAQRGTAMPNAERVAPQLHVLTPGNDPKLIDPDLTIGTLPNGMRYYIRVNKSPAKRAELWLAVNAGSLQEDDDQQGYAHFLEHMAFNGTRHFPHNSLIDFVEQSGMSFGADLNAYTNFDETVYMLTLPTDDDGTIIRHGFDVIEDWASGGMTLDSSEVLAERGVVLGEWRSRVMDSTSNGIFRHQQAVLYGENSLYLNRLPIGLPALIRRATPSPLRRFYTDWYRPDLMAVVAVGDFDKAAMEREIIARFGKIPAVTSPRARRPSAVELQTGPVVDVYRGKVGPGVTVSWRAPARPDAAVEALRQKWIEQLLFGYLQSYFLKARESVQRPFVGASISRGTVGRALGDSYSLTVAATPDSLERGLAAVLTEIERVAQHGIPATDLVQRKSALLRQLESAADGRTADPSKLYATEYVGHYLAGDGLLLNEQQEYTIGRGVIPTITAKDVAKAARFWRDRAHQTIMYNLTEFISVTPPTREKLLALTDSVATLRLQAPLDTKVAPGALITTPPAPGRVVKEVQHAVAGVTEWTLSNGARVLYKPSYVNPDQFLLDARSLGGFSLLPDSLALSPGRLVGMMMTAAGGLGTANRDELMQQLGSSIVRYFGVEINYTDEMIGMGGSPKNLETLFQLLYLQFTAPKMDTAALSNWKRYGQQTLSMSTNDQVGGLLSRGNPRLAPPSAALVDLVDLDQAMVIYKDRFGDAGDFTFALVGAAPVEQVKPLVERYIASLPSLHRSEREKPKDPHIKPWSGIERSTRRVLDVPKASTSIVSDGLMPSDPEENLTARRQLSTVEWVLRRRLRNVLREKLGGTYSVGVSSVLYANPHEHFQTLINFDAAPERADTLIDVLLANIDSVRNSGATPEELAVIAVIQKRARETALQSNANWVSTLQTYDRVGIPIDKIMEPAKTVMSPQQVSSAARKYFPANSFIHITYMPKDSTMTSADDGAQKNDSTNTKAAPSLQLFLRSDTRSGDHNITTPRLPSSLAAPSIAP